MKLHRISEPLINFYKSLRIAPSTILSEVCRKQKPGIGDLKARIAAVRQKQSSSCF